jgi:tRNA modification GTPase
LVQGTTRARFEELRGGIIKCLSLLEALIDFGEGEDIEEGVYDQGSTFLFSEHISLTLHPTRQHENELKTYTKPSSPIYPITAKARSSDQVSV